MTEDNFSIIYFSLTVYKGNLTSVNLSSTTRQKPTILPNTLEVPIYKLTVLIINYSFLYPKLIPRVPLFFNWDKKTTHNIKFTIPTSPCAQYSMVNCMCIAVQQNGMLFFSTGNLFRHRTSRLMALNIISKSDFIDSFHFEMRWCSSSLWYVR